MTPDETGRFADLHDHKVAKIAQPNWYWAAVGVTVRTHYPVAQKYSQCELAGILLGRAECCEDGAACNVEYDMEQTLRALGHFQSRAEGGLDCVEASKITGRGDLVILQRAAAVSGGPKTYHVLFESGMNPMEPTNYYSYIGNVQTGQIETRGHYPYDVIKAEMRYITRLGR